MYVPLNSQKASFPTHSSIVSIQAFLQSKYIANKEVDSMVDSKPTSVSSSDGLRTRRTSGKEFFL